jgi:pyruvate/2-oxoglutarate dehydrogenase complex dihydrolipoamide acyltransferase (E2) component
MIVGAIIGGVAALAICGYFGYRMLFGSGSGSHVASSETSSSSTASPPAATEASKDAAPASQSASQDTASSQTSIATPPDSEAKPAASDSAKAPTGSGSDASKASAAQDASKMGMTASTKDSGKSGASTKAGTPSPAAPGAAAVPTEAPKAVAQGTNPAAPSPPPDRWRQMRDAMSKCSGETFFKRVACEQAVGLQYCEGYWGRVPQCPSGPPKDHGQ